MSSHFDGSPFTLTAGKDIAPLWAGRTATKAHLERLRKSYNNRGDSSLDLIWSNLGAGKSHALHHFRHLLTCDPNSSRPILCAYLEVPEQLTKFLDLYKSIASSIPLAPAMELVARGVSENGHTNLKRCATAFLYGGSTERDLAVEWFRGNRPHLRDLRSATAIDSRIEDDATATDVLANLIELVAGLSGRLVLLIDEFQRVAPLQEHRRNAVLSSVRTLFSRNPKGVSAVLAASCRIEKNAMDLLPRELQTIMGMKPSITLPEMSLEEAVEFVRDRFAYFRPGGYSAEVFAPFDDAGIMHVLKTIQDKEEASMIPRTILQVLGMLYDELLEEESGRIKRESIPPFLDTLRWSP
jgi:hypothetical protein